MTGPSSPALFIAAHPDDEVLAMCVPIAEHVRAGQQVHVLWLTDGEASGVRGQINGVGSVSGWWGVPHVPADEGYAPLTPAAFGQARIREASAAVRLLSTGYPGTPTLHRAGLADGAVTEAAARAAILAVCDAVAPGGPARLKSHSPVVEDHPDHVAAGAAVRSLSTADPIRFADVRHYILPSYWADPRLGQVAEAFDTPADPAVATRCRNATRAFQAWSPPHTFAVGYHSVPAIFAAIDTNPRSLVHP